MSFCKIEIESGNDDCTGFSYYSLNGLQEKYLYPNWSGRDIALRSELTSHRL